MPTKLWVLSDLHQEWPENECDPTADAPDAFDVVVVAGDVDTPGDRALDRLAAWFPGVPVVYVPGNHDFYLRDDEPAYTLWDMRERMAERAARHGVTLLDDSAAVLAGTRFLGGTLWTDLRLGTHGRAEAHASARKGMNDYRHVRRKRSGKHRHLRTNETVELHRATRRYLDEALATPFDGPTVVVTHHAPSPRSVLRGHSDMNHCYVSDLEWLMEAHRPVLWVHGHLHGHSDFRVGDTRVVANPRGHTAERDGFVPGMVVEVG